MNFNLIIWQGATEEIDKNLISTIRRAINQFKQNPIARGMNLNQKKNENKIALLNIKAPGNFCKMSREFDIHQWNGR